MSNNILITILSIILILCACADYDLLNLDEPESVNLSIKSVTDSTVTLVWSKSNDEDFFNYKVYYSRNETVDQNDSLVDSLSFRIDTSKTVRNLIPGTRYYFRVIVNTGRGLFSASNEVDTVTLRDTSADTSLILKLYAPAIISDASIILRWSKVHFTFDAYKVFIDTTWDVTNADSVIGTVYHDTTLVVNGLVKNRTYWYRVYVTKDIGYIVGSNSVEVKIP